MGVPIPAAEKGWESRAPRQRKGWGSRAGRSPPPGRRPPRPALLPRREKGQRCPNKAIGSQELLPKITPLEPGPRLGALL